MNNKISISVLVAIIATSICFSLNFFSNTYFFNGWDFFLAYAILTITFSLPMSKIAIYTDRVAPLTQTHVEVIKKYSQTDKLRPFSLIITGVLLLILSIVFFNESTYILDVFDNISGIDRLSNPSLIFSNQYFMYSIFTIIAIVSFALCFFAMKGRIDIDRLIEIVAIFTISVIIVLVLVVAYKTEYTNGFINFFEYDFDYNFNEMLGMATIYAILSNFISITVFKSIVKIKKDTIRNVNINKVAIQNAIFTVLLSFIICITMYSLIRAHAPNLSTTEVLKSTAIFKIFAAKAPISYILLETTYLMLTLLTLFVALGYLAVICKKDNKRIVILAIPTAMCFSFIHSHFYFVDFSKLLVLHIIIIYAFLFDIFVIGWLYDAQRFSYEMLKNTNTKVSPLFNILIRLVIPALCLFAAVGYIFTNLCLGYVAAITITLLIIYIIKGIIFKKVFGQRRY